MGAVKSPAAPAPKKRERRHPCNYPYIRRPSKGFKYQARAWVSWPVCSVNLGLYDDEWSAHRAVRAWIKAGADPCHGLPDGILPKWVTEPVPGSFIGQVRLAGVFHVAGPFDTAAEAHVAVRDKYVRPHLSGRGPKLRGESGSGRNSFGPASSNSWPMG